MFWFAVSAALAGQVDIVSVGTPFVNVYALHDGDSIVLVDAHNPGREDAILRRMAREGLDPDQVTALVVTHGHPDHAGSAAALSEALDVPVIAGSREVERLAAGRPPLNPTGFRGRLVSALVGKRFPPVEVDQTVEDTLSLEPYGVEGVVRQVGGHTPGELVLELPGGRVLVGDLIRGHLMRHRVPALHFFHDEPLVAHEQLREVTGDAVTLYPCHGGPLGADLVGEWLEERGVRYDRRFQAAAR